MSTPTQSRPKKAVPKKAPVKRFDFPQLPIFLCYAANALKHSRYAMNQLDPKEWSSTQIDAHVRIVQTFQGECEHYLSALSEFDRNVLKGAAWALTQDDPEPALCDHTDSDGVPCRIYDCLLGAATDHPRYAFLADRPFIEFTVILE